MKYFILILCVTMFVFSSENIRSKNNSSLIALASNSDKLNRLENDIKLAKARSTKGLWYMLVIKGTGNFKNN